AVLDAAFEIGIRYLDAARSYGRAEQFLASWLNVREIGREHVTVGSKWGYVYVADWRVDAEVHEVKDHSLATLGKQIAESRAMLGDVLALYQIHSATLESGVLEDRQVLDELRRLRQESLVIGLSTSGPRQSETIRRALDVDVAGSNPFGAVQATWNLLETSAGPALAEAHEAGWGVLVKEAMANGRLGPRGRGPHREDVDGVAERHEVGSDALAIAAALVQPWADVVLSGAVTPAQVRSNATALGVVLREEDTAALGGLAEPVDEYWTRRSSLPWS
ncbi:MAG: aldo/keto reductase, partial [Actinomycetota bacterium]